MLIISISIYFLSKVTPFAEIGDLSANLGRVPILVTEHGTIGQSAAINFYLANHLGMMGSNPFEAAVVVELCEHLKELAEVYSKLVPWGTEPTAEALDKFFDSEEAADYSGPADGSKRGARALKWYLARMEGLVADGFAVGTKVGTQDELDLTPTQNYFSCCTHFNRRCLSPA